MSHNRLSCGLQLSDRCYRNDEVLRTWPEKGKIRPSSLMSLFVSCKPHHNKSRTIKTLSWLSLNFRMFTGKLCVLRWCMNPADYSQPLAEGFFACVACNEGELSRKPAKQCSRCFGFPSNCPLGCVTAEIYAIGQKCIFSFLLVSC